MNMALNILMDRVIVDPGTMTGKPIIRGTRIPVDTLIRMMAQGMTENEILQEYPRLSHEDIKAALTYAADALAHEDVFPMVATH